LIKSGRCVWPHRPTTQPWKCRQLAPVAGAISFWPPARLGSSVLSPGRLMGFLAAATSCLPRFSGMVFPQAIRGHPREARPARRCRCPVDPTNFLYERERPLYRPGPGTRQSPCNHERSRLPVCPISCAHEARTSCRVTDFRRLLDTNERAAVPRRDSPDDRGSAVLDARELIVWALGYDWPAGAVSAPDNTRL
jgi:hypothetical protein